MNDLPAAPLRRRLLGWCLLALVLAFFGWGGWREYDYRCAVEEVKAAGPHWDWRTRDPVDVIRWNWRAAFRLATWTDRSRHLIIDPDAEMIAHARLEGPDFAKIHNLLRRLRPTAMFARKCKNVDLNGLAGLTDLEEIVLFDCYELRSLDGLQGLTEVRKVVIQNCGLERLDGLQGLTSLRHPDAFGKTDLREEVRLWRSKTGCSVPFASPAPAPPPERQPGSRQAQQRQRS